MEERKRKKDKRIKRHKTRPSRPTMRPLWMNVFYERMFFYEWMFYINECFFYEWMSFMNGLELLFWCKNARYDVFNECVTNQQTNQPTDTAYYRDVRTHLKTRVDRKRSRTKSRKRKRKIENVKDTTKRFGGTRSNCDRKKNYDLEWRVIKNADQWLQSFSLTAALLHYHGDGRKVFFPFFLQDDNSYPKIAKFFSFFRTS